MSELKIKLKGEPVPGRLDSFLAGRSEFVSRSQIKRLIEDGRVLVNGRAVKPAAKVRAGDVIEVTIPDPKPAGPRPEAIPLKVLYEDRHLLVIDKPPGLATHPAPGTNEGTLVNALLFHCQDLSGIGGELKPGIVHRLDKLTSGVMVSAKSDRAHAGLAEQFKAHSIERAYLALVWGVMEKNSGSMKTLYGRNPAHRMKMTGRVSRGRVAITEWSARERFRHFTLVEARLFTGRTHQVRVHFSESGHPLVGDPLYGKGRAASQKLPAEVRDALAGLKRQALHACKLGFVHPITREKMTFTSQPPADMAAVIKILEEFDR